MLSRHRACGSIIEISVCSTSRSTEGFRWWAASCATGCAIRYMRPACPNAADTRVAQASL